MARKRMADVMEMDEEEALDAHNEAFGEETEEEMVEADENEEIEGEEVEIEIKRYRKTEMLKVELTQEEMMAASKEMARALDEIRSLENGKKAAVEDFKARIAREEATAQVNSGLVRNGYEYRDTPVEITFDYVEGRVTKMRLDTGEIVEDRKMTMAERQMTI